MNRSILIPVVLFLILLFAWATLEYWGEDQKTSTLPQQVWQIDSMAMEKVVLIEEAGREPAIELQKREGQWYLKHGDLWVSPNTNQLERTFSHIVDLRPQGLAATSDDRYEDLGVDVSGNRVRVIHEDGRVAELIIGDYSLRDEKQAVSYFRKRDGKEVYSASEYLEASLAETEHSAWRKSTLLDTEPDEIKQVEISVLDEGQYRLIREDGAWRFMDEGHTAYNVAKWLDEYKQIVEENFLETHLYEELRGPVAEVDFIMDDKVVTLKGYLLEDQFVLGSSINENNYMIVEEGYFQGLFTPPERFEN